MNNGLPETETAPTILLVEDSRLFTSVLSYRFQKELGVAVQPCGSLSAVQAALAARDKNYVLAVVDLNLPGSPRGEVLNLTLANDIPTIVFTASFSPETRAEILQRHVIDYVMKDNDLALEKAFVAVRQALENRKRRVLVVERNAAMRAEIAQAMRRMMFQVEDTPAGWDAVSRLEKAAYHLVITGEQLKDMSGAEFCRRVRKLHAANRLGLIGLYPAEDDFNGLAFLRAGASDAVRLPIVPEEFQCRVAQLVDMLGQMQVLRASSASDYLTGLYNRRYYFAEGPKLISQSLKAELPISIGVLDIDHFKRLNDTYGHEIGDLVLVAVAGRLKAEIEGTEYLLCRLGGEEFSMLVTGLEPAEATAFFDQLRERISTVKVVADEEELSITVSIGVAEVSGYETFDNYINAADQFLYMAKHRGRNQVYSDYLMAEESGRTRRAAG